MDAPSFERIRGMQACFDALHQRREASFADALASDGANYLVTGAKHLLALADRYPIITPAAFWAAHGGL